MSDIELIVRGIIVQDEKILLCKNLEQGFYYLPGGHVERGEFPEQAFKREMLEELGKNTQNIKKIAETKNSFVEKGKECSEVAHIYLAVLENYENIKSLESHIAFEWIPIEKFNSIDFKPHKAIEDIFKSIEANKIFWI